MLTRTGKTTCNTVVTLTCMTNFYYDVISLVATSTEVNSYSHKNKYDNDTNNKSVLMSMISFTRTTHISKWKNRPMPFHLATHLWITFLYTVLVTSASYSYCPLKRLASCAVSVTILQVNLGYFTTQFSSSCSGRESLGISGTGFL